MRILGFGLMILLLTSCQNKDANYYRFHPKALQTALQQCPQQSTAVSCDTLNHIADEVNQLAYALHQNPQEFGNQILALQNQMVTLSQPAVNKENQSKIS